MLNMSADKPGQDASSDATLTDGTSNQHAPFANAGYPGFGFFGGRGGRGWGNPHFRGMGRGGGHFRPETVQLDGDEHGPRGPHNHPLHHGSPPPPGRAHPFWGAPSAPDPPLAPMPPPPGPEPTAFGAGFDPSGLAGLMGQHARNFAGDIAAHFGAPPADGSMHGGPPGYTLRGREFGGWRGRGGPGFRGGWRGRWGHGPHHGHGEFVHPRMDIFVNDNIYTVTIELPGLQKQNIDISVTEGLLTISGEFPSSNPPMDDDPFAEYDIMDDEGEEVMMEAAATNHEGGRYILHERSSGKFKRSIRLPSWVDMDSIKATMADGVLTLTLEKPQPESTPATTRKVMIA